MSNFNKFNRKNYRPLTLTSKRIHFDELQNLPGNRTHIDFDSVIFVQSLDGIHTEILDVYKTKDCFIFDFPHKAVAGMYFNFKY